MKKKNVFLLAVAAVMAFAVSVSAETLGDLEYKIENGEITITGCNQNATNVTIPAEIDGCPVTSIGDSVFSDCHGLTSINIPASVTSIGDLAFYGCTGLTSINIPASVTSIGDAAFYNCEGLTSINIPESVISIGMNLFSRCAKLTEINVDENNSTYNAVAGVLFQKDKKTLIKCPEGKKGEYSVPESVTSIGDGAFQECTGLTSINIPDGVTRIGEFAFLECIGLININIPKSVTSIGDYAFSNLPQLKNVYYTGTREQFENINKAPDIGDLLNATIHYEWKPISVLLNGNAINFDVPPQIINDRTMVPLRAIFESLGAEVEWIDRGENDKEIVSVKGNKKISMKIDNTLMNVTDSASGESRDITLDTPATLVDSRTLVPVRAISEAFGCDVEWNGDLKQVIITE